MPPEKADIDPADVKGLPLDPKDINQSGEPQGRAALRRGLGLSKDEDTTEDDDDDLDDEDDEDLEDDDEKPSQRKKKDEDDDESGRKKSKKLPKGAEKDPNDLGENYESFVQRNAEEAYAIALHRAKEEDGYLDKLVASKDPIDQRLAKKRMEGSSNERSWNQWKKENAVNGKAAEIADDIHARYPDMPEGEVMEFVKGKLGGSYRAPQ